MHTLESPTCSAQPSSSSEPEIMPVTQCGRKLHQPHPDSTPEKLAGWGDPRRTTRTLRVSKRAVAKSEETH